MDQLAKLIKEKAFKEGTCKLASGKNSQYYIDMSKVSLTFEGIYAIVCGIYRAAQGVLSSIDSIGGPILGAAPIVSGMIMLAPHSSHQLVQQTNVEDSMFVRSQKTDK